MLFREGGEVISTPGVDGTPYRGTQIPILKQGEYDRLEQVLDTRVRIFDLSIPADLTAYQQIVDAIGKRTSVISHEEIQWVPAKNNWMVFLRYCNKFVETPGYQNGRARNVNGQITYGPPATQAIATGATPVQTG